MSEFAPWLKGNYGISGTIGQPDADLASGTVLFELVSWLPKEFTENDKMVTNSNSLSESIRKAIEDEGARDNISLSLQVAGGSPEETYNFFLSASGQGTVKYRFSDKLRGVEERAGQVTLESDEMADLFNSIFESGVLEIEELPPGFIPGTTVGKLEVSDGKETYTTFFAAEIDQAKVQDRSPPPELIEAVEAIYALGAEIMGVQSAKP